ncbi:3-phosphoserine/phosphohydroxythreonine transaminase [Candidatus Margulisiibacteriota bacterium]
MTNRVYNFYAGPAVLPLPVLEKAQKELLNYDNSGMSIMELSHRSNTFVNVLESAEARIRRLFQIPDEYAVLFLQGGASLQFAMIPLNLYLDNQPVDCINTGNWTKKAISEINKVGSTNLLASSEDRNFSYIPDVDNLKFNDQASYLYITSNNTIFGTQYQKFPKKNNNVPIVADMSSDILSRKIDIQNFDLIIAGAQKNIGPSGASLVIIRKELAERAKESLPTFLQYRTHIKHSSLYNTPPTFPIYIINLVMEWVEENGGLDVVEANNNKKAQLLYNAIDESSFYYCPTEKTSRSKMNVVYRITGDKDDLEKQFAAEAAEKGLVGLKGHRSVGGLRASIYNSQSLEAVETLVAFMQEFEKKNK